MVRMRKSDENVHPAENNLDCVGKTCILERTFCCRLFIRSLFRQRRILCSCHNCLFLSRQSRCPFADFSFHECDQWMAQMLFRIVSEYCVLLITHPVTLTTSQGLVLGSPGTWQSINRKFKFSPNEYYVFRPLLSTYSCVNVRSSGDSPLANLCQMRDYHWTIEDRASSRY